MLSPRTLFSLLSLLLVSAAAPAGALTQDTRPETENSPTIAVPEAVKTSPFSGSVGYSYQFDLPRGTGGLTPALTLTYSTLTKSTEYGFGWDLGIPKIERSTRFGAPDYLPVAQAVPAGARGDQEDRAHRFEYDGELLMRDPDDASRFHTRLASGARILYKTDRGGPDGYWEVTQPDGTKLFFGRDEDGAGADADSTLHRNADGSEVFRWGLDAVVDPRGNEYRIEYFKYAVPLFDQGTVFPIYIYPKRIRYSFHPNASAAQQERLVEFAWEVRGETPDNYDHPTSYRAAMRVQQRQRLWWVKVGLDANGDGAVDGGEQIRRYELFYAPKPTQADPAHPPYSQLETIQRYGSDDTPFPTATTFEYSPEPTAFESMPHTVWGTSDLPSINLMDVWSLGSAAQTGLHDMNGDGFVDHVEAGFGSWQIRYGGSDGTNHGFGSIDAAGAWTPGGAPSSWAFDGSTVPAGKQYDYAISVSENATWMNPEWTPTSGYWDSSTATYAELLDVDGDGRPDRLMGGYSDAVPGRVGPCPGGIWEHCAGTIGPFVSMNNGAGFDSPIPYDIMATGNPTTLMHTHNGGLRHNPMLNGEATVVEWMDVTGDGKPDLFEYPAFIYPGTGTGVGAEQTWERSTTTKYKGAGLSGTGVSGRFAGVTAFNVFVDLNGDGLPDHVEDDLCVGTTEPHGVDFNLGYTWQYPTGTGHEASSTNVQVQSSSCKSQGNFGPQDMATTQNGFYKTTEAITTLIDMNGDGVVDLVHSVRTHVVPGDPVIDPGFDLLVYPGLGDGRFLSTGTSVTTFLDSFVPGDGIHWNVPHWAGGAAEVTSRTFRRSVLAIGDKTESDIDLVDLNGDGMPDFVYSDQVSAWKTWLHPGPSGQLQKVTNELGGWTSIDYTSSGESVFEAAQSAVVDPNEGLAPGILVRSPARWLVSEVEVSDGRSGTPTQLESLHYAELRYDVERREAMGVRMAESTDAAGVMTRTLYHQDPLRRGRPQVRETFDSADTLLASTETTWVALSAYNENASQSKVQPNSLGQEEQSPIDGSYFVRATGEVSTTHEASGGSQVQTTSRWYSRVTGQMVKERTEASGQGVEVRTHYRPNWSEWLISYAKGTATVLDGDVSGGNAGVRDRKVVNYYNNLHDAELPPTDGLVREVATWLDGFGLGTTWSHEEAAYDEFGNPIAYSDATALANGVTTQTTTYDSDTNTFPKSVTNALGHAAYFDIDPAFGKVTKTLTMTDDDILRGKPGGLRKCWTYDTFGRMQSRREHSAPVSALYGLVGSCNSLLARFSFPNIGDPDTQHILAVNEFMVPIPPWFIFPGFKSRQYFDGLGRVYEEHQHAGGFDHLGTSDYLVTTRAWDDRGQQTCESLPFRQPGATRHDCESRTPRRMTTFDERGRPLRLELEGAVATTLEQQIAYAMGDLDGDPDFDELIRTVTTFGQPNREQIYGHSAWGEVVVIEEDGEKTFLNRDPAQRIVSIDGPDVAGDTNILSVSYDHRGARTSITMPGGTAPWLYSYDAAGNLSEQTTPAGDTIRYHYDVLNRLIVKDLAPLATTAAGANWDEDTGLFYDNFLGKGTNTMGRLAFVNAPDVRTGFRYTPRGQVKRRTRNYDGGWQFIHTFTYDLLGRPVVVQQPDKTRATYVYDGSYLGRIIHTAVGGDIVNSLEYHDGGGVERIEFPQAGTLQSQYTYDADTHRLKTAYTSNAAGTIQNLSYGYDTAGNVLQALDGGTGPAGNLAVKLSQTFTYDTSHRLSSVASTGTLNYGNRSYGYDTAGNLTTKGDLTLQYGAANGGPHAVSVVNDLGTPVGSYRYDANGAVTQKDAYGTELNLSRDAEGLLTGFCTGTGCITPEATYEYDDVGERSRKILASGDETLYVSPDYETRIEAGVASHAIHVFLGPRRIATIERSGAGTASSPGTTQDVHYFHSDHVGSNTAITDSSGSLVQETVLSPFGEIQASSTAASSRVSNYLFTDQENDRESGLDYFGARYYDSWVGSFLSVDPELFGGVTFDGIQADVRRYGSHRYALNAPTVLVDPTGRYEEGLPAWTSDGQVIKGGLTFGQIADLKGGGKTLAVTTGGELVSISMASPGSSSAATPALLTGGPPPAEPQQLGNHEVSKAEPYDVWSDGWTPRPSHEAGALDFGNDTLNNLSRYVDAEVAREDANRIVEGGWLVGARDSYIVNIKQPDGGARPGEYIAQEAAKIGGYIWNAYMLDRARAARLIPTFERERARALFDLNYDTALRDSSRR